MSNDKEGRVVKGRMWNGGNTNLSIKYDKMIRQSEDFIDEIDCESSTRESLLKRQQVMNKGRVGKPSVKGRVEIIDENKR